jgi:Protein of unknown function (DUF1214)
VTGTLPAPIPVGQFWSFMVYDGQTRSILETDQKLAGLDSNQNGIKKNSDGSVTVWFAPKAPAGEENNWVQTMPGKGWNSLLRLYAPLVGRLRARGLRLHLTPQRPERDCAPASDADLLACYGGTADFGRFFPAP